MQEANVLVNCPKCGHLFETCAIVTGPKKTASPTCKRCYYTFTVNVKGWPQVRRVK